MNNPKERLEIVVKKARKNNHKGNRQKGWE